MKTDTYFLSYLAHFFLEWEMFQLEVVEKIKTHILCSINPPPPESSAVYEITWKNIVEPDRPLMTIWGMLIACWIPKATNIHSQYVVLITFPQQQWLHERASILRHKYVDCRVIKKNKMFAKQ